MLLKCGYLRCIVVLCCILSANHYNFVVEVFLYPVSCNSALKVARIKILAVVLVEKFTVTGSWIWNKRRPFLLTSVGCS